MTWIVGKSGDSLVDCAGVGPFLMLLTCREHGKMLMINKIESVGPVNRSVTHGQCDARFAATFPAA